MKSASGDWLINSILSGGSGVAVQLPAASAGLGDSAIMHTVVECAETGARYRVVNIGLLNWRADAAGIRILHLEPVTGPLVSELKRDMHLVPVRDWIASISKTRCSD